MEHNISNSICRLFVFVFVFVFVIVIVVYLLSFVNLQSSIKAEHNITKSSPLVDLQLRAFGIIYEVLI